jgi:hypothetical protein
MIPAAAVDEYLGRELDSHLWMKDLDEAEVDAALAALRPRPWIWPGTRLHQKVCILLGIAYPGFGFWVDMGGGKTLIALTLLRYWWDAGLIRRALVFVTSDKAFLTWEKQIRRFEVGLPYLALEGSSDDKWRQLDELGEGVVLVTRPGAVAMCSEKVVVKREGKKPKAQMQLVPRQVGALARWAGAVVWDESTREGHHSSLTYKLAEKLRRAAARHYALAGRPFGRDPTLLHAQYKLIDDGATLGETLGLFRAAFFSAHAPSWRREVGRGRRQTRRQQHVVEYKFRDDMRPQLSRMIQHRSITYTADECTDLPAVIPIVEEVSFPTEAAAYYDRVVKDLIKAKGNYRAAKNAFLRMRQVSSGFVSVKDDETGARAEIEFAENPKLERLLDLMADMPETARAVVFYEFTHSGRKIVEALKREFDDEPIWLWSGTKDARGEIQRFLNDDGCQTAVIQHRVGAYSLDGLQEVAYFTYFYESPISPIDREQAERRLERDGQRHKVRRYDIVVRGSMDQRILDMLAEGNDIMQAVMRDPARAIGRR